MRREEKDPGKSVSAEQDLSGVGESGEGSTTAANMDVAENILYTFDALHSGYAEVSKEECSHPIDTSFIR